MVGDGLNDPRYQGGKPQVAEDEKHFPDKYSMRYTRILNLRGLGLSEVPHHLIETACSEYVTSVNLGSNQLRQLPSNLHKMADLLTDLDLDKNKLWFVPTFIWKFSRLTRLNLCGNMLQDLPIALDSLQQLCELNISYNHFEHIPCCIYALESLEVLIANDNRIIDIDATEYGLAALRRLRVLKLSNNNIQKVPPELGNMKSITTLELWGNPFRLPRYQVIELGTGAIMSYLRERIPK